MPDQRRVSDLWLAAHSIYAVLQVMVIAHSHSGGRGARRQSSLAAPALCWLFVAIASALTASRAVADHTKETRVFGILPIVSTERLARRFEPLATYLADELGVSIVLETAPDYAEFTRRTSAEHRYDYLFTAPHFYFLAHRQAGYRAVARVGGEPARGLIVVRRDSGISDLAELCGRSIATPDSLSLMTLLIREPLLEAGCDRERAARLVPTPSHNAALMSVFQGATDGAALGTVPLGNADTEMRAEIRIVAETGSVPSMPFSVAPWIPDAEAAQLADALISLSESAEGAELLEHLGWSGFAAAEPDDYDMLEVYLSSTDNP